MKKWNTPIIESLSISDTACGGSKPSEHDGCIYEIEFGFGKTMVEEYFPSSGDAGKCGKHNKRV